MTTTDRFDIRALALVITNEQAFLDTLTRTALDAREAFRRTTHGPDAERALREMRDAEDDVRRAEMRIRHYRFVWGTLTGVHGEDADSDIAAIAATTSYRAYYSPMVD